MHGEFTIIKRNAILKNGEWIPGEIISKHTEINNKGYEYYTGFIEGSGIYMTSTLNADVIITERKAKVLDCTSHIYNDAITGTNISRTWYPPSGGNNGYYEIQTRFDPPSAGTSRTIRGVFVGYNGSLTYKQSAGSELTTPCIQADNEILDIYYRIVTDNTLVLNNSNVNEWAVEELSKTFALVSTAPSSTNFYPKNMYVDSFNKTLVGIFNNHIASVSITSPTTKYNVIESTIKKEISVGLADNIGTHFGIIYLGNNSYRLNSGTLVKRSGDSSVQNTYPRSAGNNKPYLDTDNLAIGSGEVTVSDTTNGWTSKDGLASLYRVKITTSGEAGTAEYKLKKSILSQTYGNTFDSYPSRILSLPKTGVTDTPRTIDGTDNTRHGATVNKADAFMLRYVYPEFIMADINGITIVGVDGIFENIDNNSTPALPATSINQIAYMNDGTILVACASTGLWKITRNLTTRQVTNISQVIPSGVVNGNSCRAIDIQRGTGNWYAIFDKELGKSTDNGVTWTIYNESTTPPFELTGYTGATDDATYLQHISVHPTSTNGKMYISAPDGVNDGSRNDAFWWDDTVSGPATRLNNGTYGGTFVGKKLYGSNKVSCMADATTEKWIVKYSANRYASLLDYNVTTYPAYNSNYVSIGEYAGIMYNVDNNGDEYIIGQNSGGDTIVGRKLSNLGLATYDYVLQYNSTSSPKSIASTYVMSSLMITFENGVCVTHGSASNTSYSTNAYTVYKMCNDPIDQNESLNGYWIDYGWNGTDWVEGNSNSKVVHTTTEDLIDGLEISFTNNAGGNSFVSGDWYDIYLYDGILKDDATSTDLSTGIIMCANDIVTLSGTIPASNIGVVTNEDGYLLNDYALENNYNSGVYGTPGKVGITYSTPTNAQTSFEEELIGEFSVNFKVDVVGANSSFKSPYVSLQSFAYDYSSTNVIQMRFDFSSSLDRSTGTIQVYENTTLVHTENITGGDYDDIYSFTRDASNIITLSRNGTVFYTMSAAVSSNLQIGASFSLSVNTVAQLYDIEVDYDIQRIYVDIGDEVATTGRNDINFRKIFTDIDMRDNFNHIELDGVPAQINYDGFTAPAPGEVTIMPYSGRIWCNIADAGKTITGEILYLKQINLV